MKSASINAAALASVICAFSSSYVMACSEQASVEITFYGYADNSPPGAATAYNCGGRNYVAGGKVSSKQLRL